MIVLRKIGIIVIVAGIALVAKAQVPPGSYAPAPQPIRVEITSPAEAQPGWVKWISLTEKIAWPVVAIFGLFLFRKPLTNFLDVVGKRATEISIGSLGIKLPTMSEAPLSDDVLTFKAADPLMIVNDSAKSTLFNMFQGTEKFEFAVVNLGRGDQWLSSRLYIFALMLHRMKSLRCIVFVANGPDTETQFIGTTTPEKIRWSLARFQPWLETAYIQAQQTTAPLIQDEHGAVDPGSAEQIVRNYLSNITTPNATRIETDPEWVLLDSSQKWEHATWLSPDYLVAAFSYVLWTDTIVSSELKKEAKGLLSCSAPFVAKIKKNGEFVSLIDRMAFLDEMATKMADKLAGNA
jgi:hypothetical protein